MEHAQYINIKIIQQLNEAEIEFAFPTQMLHLSDNVNINKDRDHLKEK